MKTRFLFSLLLMLPMLHQAQVASTASLGSYAVGDQDINFTDNSLSNPAVVAKAFYPATAAGTNQPVASGTFPVIAFGHGFNLDYLDYQILCRHLASWGYIIISPDVQNGFNVSHQEYARELAACITYLQSEGANANSAFFQKTDTMTGVCGHSMGGGASGLVPGVFNSIDAVSGLAAAETNPSAIAALANYAGPFQAISGSEDNVAPESSNQIPMYNATTGFKQHVSIVGGGHCKFTDGTTVCDFVSGAGSITRDDQIYLSKKYLTAFFNYFLKSDQTALPFLCGDSILADQNQGHVTFSSNLSCQPTLLEHKLDDGARVWPQPATDRLHFRASGTATLVDGLGRTIARVQSGLQGEGCFDLRDLPAGIYLLRTEQFAQRVWLH